MENLFTSLVISLHQKDIIRVLMAMDNGNRPVSPSTMQVGVDCFKHNTIYFRNLRCNLSNIEIFSYPISHSHKLKLAKPDNQTIQIGYPREVQVIFIFSKQQKEPFGLDQI